MSLLILSWGVLNLSCTNLGRLASSRSSRSTASSDSTTNSGSFRLIQVLGSQQGAGSQFDFIGDGNEFDAVCGASLSACRCVYTYVQSSVTQTVEATPTYQESNLIRCANLVPSGINSFDTKIRSEDNVSFTNTIRVQLTNGSFSGSSIFLDLSQESSFLQVKRFQCRKHEFIPNPLDPSMIDPFQSEDPRVIYPFNFYTTNVGESLLKYQRSGNQQWECTLLETQDRTLHTWANPRVFSTSPCFEAFCSADSEEMAPTSSLVSNKIPVSNLAANGKKRSSFWLAKQPYGVFQTPVQAAIAPSGYEGSTYGQIGYAAKPIPNSTGSSDCPSITLPSNAYWVKLWNFRATDITPPKYVTASTAANISTIACYPTETDAFQSCAENNTNGGSPFGTLMSATTDAILASRVAALTNGAGNANACYNVNKASWIGGAETWTPSAIGFGDPANGGLSASQINSLPWSIYQNAGVDAVCNNLPDSVWRLHDGIAACGTATNANIVSLPGTPQDSQVQTASFTTSNYTDQIFVVTDPSVSDTQMRNQSSSVSHYRPVTYRTQSDCSLASRATCPVSKEIHWDVSVKEVGSNSGADVYPVCVLQFYD